MNLTDWLNSLTQRFNRQKQRRLRDVKLRPLRIEQLECRQLMAADVIAADFHVHTFAHLIEREPGLLTDSLGRFSIRIFLSSPNEAQTEAAMKAVATLCESLQCEIVGEDPAEHGSWFKRLFGKAKDVASSEEVAIRLRKLERAIQIKTLDLPQADADKKLLEGVATFLDAVADNDAILQLGSVLLVKRTTDDGKSCVVTKTLTQTQLSYLEDNPRHFKTPNEILDALADVPDEWAIDNAITLNYEDPDDDKRHDEEEPK